eukprot:bmy_19112T0
MLSRLQELHKEGETLLRLEAALHHQLNRLEVEELALHSMIHSTRGGRLKALQQGLKSASTCSTPGRPFQKNRPNFPKTEMAAEERRVCCVLSGALYWTQVVTLGTEQEMQLALAHADPAPIPAFAFVGGINLKNKSPCVREQLSRREGFSIEDQAAM